MVTRASGEIRPKWEAHPRWDIDAMAYDEVTRRARALFTVKNRDYAGSWKLMRVTSLIDRMRTKLARIDQLETALAAVQEEQQQETALDLVNEAIFLYISLILRDGDARITPAALATARDEQIAYLTQQVRSGAINVDIAARSLQDFDACWPGAEEAWIATPWERENKDPLSQALQDEKEKSDGSDESSPVQRSERSERSERSQGG